MLAATNKDLQTEIEIGNFREDLFFRLSVIPIKVPPLRQRVEDIPELVTHFSLLFAKENNFKAKSFSRAALEIMQGYLWRGNIRELRNSIERLLVMTTNSIIDVKDVHFLLGIYQGTEDEEEKSKVGQTLRDFKESSERKFLVAKLREFRWNISKTSEEIETPRSNLYKKLEQYNINQETDA